MSDSEVWKDIAGYEGLYQVSNKGNIHSVERINLRGSKCGGRTLKPRDHKEGYLHVALSKNGIAKNKLVHRLVAEAFIENQNNYPIINHKDEVRANNNVENLEWCTKAYNMNYGNARKKSIQKLSKKVKAVNIKTGENLTFNSAKEAHGKGYPNASRACRRGYKDRKGNLIGGGNLYKGHKWYYEEENKYDKNL